MLGVSWGSTTLLVSVFCGTANFGTVPVSEILIPNTTASL